MKFYLLDKNENIIDNPPSEDILELFQDIQSHKADAVSGSLVLDERYTKDLDNVRYFAISDRNSEHNFWLYRKTIAQVQNKEIIFNGTGAFYDDLKGYGYIKEKRPNNITSVQALHLILDNTRWNIDYVDDRLNNEYHDADFYYLPYLDCFSKILETWQVDVVPFVNIEGNKITRRYVNLYYQQGGNNGRRFVYGSNALTVEKQTNDTDIYTALVGRGAGVEETNEDTGELTGGYSRKINFANESWSKSAGDPADKPAGQEYIEWPQATALYGYSDGAPRIGIVEFDNEKDTANLLRETWQHLLQVGVPQVQFKATVGDVGFLNLGETVTIVRYDLDIKYQTRVTGIKWNRKNENHSTITIGDKLVMSTAERLSGISSSVKQAQVTANDAKSSAGFAVNNGGVNVNWSEDEPQHPKEGDLWYQTQADGTIVMKQYEDGQWLIRVDDTTGEQIKNKVDEAIKGADAAKKSADDAVAKAEEASSNAKATADKFDDTNQKVEKALDNSTSAQSSAASAVATANSTASEFGKVKQDTASALTAALSAQTNANAAVAQASSAAANSKDAKQIAGAVSQSYKTLTDGSTMTIAELQSGLAVKLTKTDLNGYATQDWSQNQIKLTADGINGTMSSVKSTVDSQTTSINDLKADSSSFKSQFTTVNNTLGKHTTDIGSLQASSKELTTGFNTLTSDNTTNKNDISQLKQTATEVSSTLETVQTQVQNSAVGTNLYTDTQNLDNLESWWGSSYWTKITDSYKGLAVMQTTDPWKGLSQYIQVKKGDVLTYSVYAKYVSGNGTSVIYWGLNNSTEGRYISATTTNPNRVAITDSWQRISGTTVATSDGYLRPRLERGDKNSNTLQIAGIKLEKGSLATDWCPNPADNATVTAVSKLSQTVDGMQTDISKKIEQKDLNGYATETWAQNQINVSANGINGTISSVKNTVDSQTTSINDLKADSKEFKTQFTTYKDTVDRHDRDIGTLQADSKHLSSNFDSLDSDNKTNQHNIGELQQSSKDFSNTLLTVQTQVQNSAVGTNLLTGTSGTLQTITNASGWNDYIRSYQPSVTTIDSDTTYTARAWISPVSHDMFIKIFWLDSSSAIHYEVGNTISAGTSGYSTWTGTITSGATILHVTVVFTAKQSTASSVSYKEVKLEKGSHATDWCANPADNATVTAVSSISQTIDKIQGTIINKADQSQVTQLANQITSTITSANNPAGIVKEYVLKRWFDDGQTGGWHGRIAGANKDDTYQINAGNGHTAVLTFVSTSVVESKNSFAVSANEEFNFEIWIDTTLTQGDIQFGLQLTDSSGKSSFFPAITVDKNIKAAKYTGKLTIPNGYVSAMPAITKSAKASLIDWGRVTGMSITNAADTGSGSSTQVTQLSDAFGLLVRKDNLLSQINVEAGSTLIHSNKIYLDASSVIFSGSAFIPSAAITNLSASKITTGTLDAKNVSVVNLNGSSIASKSITADKLAVNAIRVGLNNELSGMVINPSDISMYSNGSMSMQLTSEGLYVTNPKNSGSGVGYIRATTLPGHSDSQGLAFDLLAGNDFMAWSHKEYYSDTDYTPLFQWYSNTAASYKGVNAGFQFYDASEFKDTVNVSGTLKVNDYSYFYSPITMNSTLDIKSYLTVKGTASFYPGGPDNTAAGRLVFGVTNITGGEQNIPSIKTGDGQTGIAFGSSELYMIINNTAYNLSRHMK